MKAGLSPRTVLHHHRVIYEALKYTVKWGLVVRNVAEAVDAPRPERSQMNVMTPDDVPIFLDAAKGSPFYDFFFVKLFTGIITGGRPVKPDAVDLRW
ncbi:MAG: site-specific integrase, partial [Chloroflexota bacterium]